MLSLIRVYNYQSIKYVDENISRDCSANDKLIFKHRFDFPSTRLDWIFNEFIENYLKGIPLKKSCFKLGLLYLSLMWAPNFRQNSFYEGATKMQPFVITVHRKGLTTEEEDLT